MAQRHAQPTHEELFHLLQETGDLQEIYDTMTELGADEDEQEFARALGYDPTII